jgi:hypothetical protein
VSVKIASAKIEGSKLDVRKGDGFDIMALSAFVGSISFALRAPSPISSLPE